MREIGAFEAEYKFAELLDWVEGGEEVSITRHGQQVARLVPTKLHGNPEAARAALARIRARAEAGKLGAFDWAEWKAYRDEGRP